MTSHGPRTAATDPGFIQNFMNKSRLSFIGTWRDKVECLLDEKVSEKEYKDACLRAENIGESRVIFHIDLDCFFASVAMRSRPELRNKPMAVCWTSEKFKSSKSASEISSANYLARDKGVRANMWLSDALKLCPELVTVPFEFEEYGDAHRKTFEHVLALSKLVEFRSIDECFAEVTEAIFTEKKKTQEDDDKVIATVAEKLRKDIFETTGCTVSIGAGPSKLLARLATSLAKPDGFQYLHQDIGAQHLRNLLCSALPGIGYQRAKDLEDTLGIKTCGQMATATLDQLSRCLKNKANDFRNMARGIDTRKWEPRPLRKSVSAQCSYGLRCNDLPHCRKVINDIALELNKRYTECSASARPAYKLVLTLWQARHENLPPGVQEQQATCKAGVGHGLCRLRSASADISFYKGSPVVLLTDAAFTLFKTLNCPIADLRGLGLSIMLKVETQHLDDSQALLDRWTLPAAKKPTTPTPTPAPKKKSSPPELRPGTLDNFFGGKAVPIVPLRSVIVVPVGLPGSGKTTFYQTLKKMPFVQRCCQDVLKKVEKVKAVVHQLASAPGNIIYVDRTNFDSAQRKHWIDIAKTHNAIVIALILDTDLTTCITRAARRSHHEGGLDSRNPALCQSVVSKLAAKRTPVASDEGFDAILTLPPELEDHEAIAKHIARFRKKQPLPHDEEDEKKRTVAQVDIDINSPSHKKSKHTEVSNLISTTTTTTTDHDDNKEAWTCEVCTYRHEGREALFLLCECCKTQRPRC